MARALRPKDEPGVLHHVFTRGVARSLIAMDSIDFDRSLYLLERAVAKFDLGCHAWCYLPNHFHLVLTSRRGNLSAAMQWLGTCAAQSFNARHTRSGHLYQGRFGSRLIESDRHVLELARYLPLNPVRAGLCDSPEKWPWSSYAATAGQRAAPWFLDAGESLRLLGSVDAFIQWVAEGVDGSVLDDSGAPHPKPPLASLLTDGSSAAIARATMHGHSIASIARHLGLSRRQVKRRLDSPNN